MIFGIRAVIEAVEAGKDIDKILIKKDLQGELVQELFASVKGQNIVVQRVPIEKINRITRKNHQGVVAFISAVTYQKLENIYLSPNRKLLSLEYHHLLNKSLYDILPISQVRIHL